MAIYYVIDRYKPTKPIVEIAASRTGIDATRGLIVKIDEGLSVRGNPKNLAELLDAKKAALLARYNEFSAVNLDPCLSVDYVDKNSCSGVMLASANTNHCLLGNGALVTVPFNLNPTEYMVVWEA